MQGWNKLDGKWWDKVDFEVISIGLRGMIVSVRELIC